MTCIANTVGILINTFYFFVGSFWQHSVLSLIISHRNWTCTAFLKTKINRILVSKCKSCKYQKSLMCSFCFPTYAPQIQRLKNEWMEVLVIQEKGLLRI